MPRQLELLGRSNLEVLPEANRSEPRLWIRRLVIWSQPGVVLREIRLRPGLNLIWTRPRIPLRNFWDALRGLTEEA